MEYAYTTIPTYPSGQIGFFLMSNDESETAMVRVATSADLVLRSPSIPNCTTTQTPLFNARKSS
jgi:hypothetical protein